MKALRYISATLFALLLCSILVPAQNRSAQKPSGQKVPAEASAQQPSFEQLGSTYYAYPDPQSSLTPAPEAYEVFYISHYGRHGSRWMTTDKRYIDLVEVFDSLYACNELTELGKDVRERLYIVWEDAKGCAGHLSPIGERQLGEIGGRMYDNFPELFTDGAFVDARSSTSVRCVLSMHYFLDRLKEKNPSLRIYPRSYTKYMDYIAYTTPEAYEFSHGNHQWRKDFKAYETKEIQPQRFLSSLFTNPDAVEDPVYFMTEMYWIASDMQNVVPDLNFYDLFTYDEFFRIWKTINARMYVANASAPVNEGLMPHSCNSLLSNIIEGADEAVGRISGDPACAEAPVAHLRFGHDTCLIRLAALMKLEGCAGVEEDMEKFHLAWQGYKVSPMAANIQLIFYRNAENDVLVKFLLNENEVGLPISTDNYPYYSWDAAKAFLEEQMK